LLVKKETAAEAVGARAYEIWQNTCKGK
jgi:hypothetical protein